MTLPARPFRHRSRAIGIWFGLLLLAIPAAAAGGELFLEKIDFDLQSDGSERACFSFSAAFSPHLFALEGERPRIVLDIPEVSRWDGKTEYPVAGVLTRNIRLYLHKAPRKLRIVLDLDPTLDFVVDPVVNQEHHILCLNVRRENE